MKNFNYKNSTMELIVCKLQDTLLNLINDITEKNDVEEEFEIPKEVKAIRERLHSLAAQLGDVLDKGMDQRDDFINTAKQLKQDIIRLAQGVNVYTSACNQMGEYFLELTKFADIKRINQNMPSDNTLITADIEEFLDGIKDAENLEAAKSMLISAVPMRMPRANFNSYVEDSLFKYFDGLSVDFVKNSIKEMEAMVCAVKTEAFGKYFPNITERINTAYSENPEKITPDDLNGYLDDSDYCLGMLGNAFEILSIYYCDTNYMLTLAAFVIDQEFLFDDNFVLKDLFFCMNNILEGKDNITAEQVSQSAVNMIEELYEKFKPKDSQLRHHISKLTEEEIDAFDEEYKTMLTTYRIICDAFAMQLSYELLGVYTNEDEEIPATKAELEEIIKGFTKRIGELIGDMPIKKQKFLKQKFLAKLPCTFGIEELTGYIDYSLEGCTDNTSIWVAYGNIFEIFDAFNFKLDGSKKHSK